MKSFLRQRQIGKNHQLPQIIAILAGSLAGISNGLLFAWPSPTIPELIQTTDITLEAASYFTVISPIAMVISAPLFPVIMDSIGRKMAMLLITIPQLLGWILIGLANDNIWMYYIAKFSSGVGDSALFGVYPIYVGEIAEPKVRGSWGNVVSTSTYLGIFLINVFGAFYNIKITALICGIITALHVVVFTFMPESPYYLLMKDKEEEARQSLSLLRWRKDVDEELTTLKADVQRQMSEKGTMKDLFTIDSNCKALLVCIGMRFAQQFSGLPAFETYTQYMFLQAGGDVEEKDAAIILSGVLFLCIFFCSFLVEKFGRRTLMIVSSFGCSIMLTIETTYFIIVQFTDFEMSSFNWLPLTGMIIYIVLLSIGLGILPTLMIGEIFSASIKGKASSIANIGLAICVISVPKLFQSLTHNFGIFSPFCFFTLCCYAGTLFSVFCVVETRGKTLEEIQQELKGNPKPVEDKIKC